MLQGLNHPLNSPPIKMMNMRTMSQRTVRTVAPKRAAVSSRRSLRVEAKRNEVSVSYAKALVELADEKSKLEPVHAGTFRFVRFLSFNIPDREAH